MKIKFPISLAALLVTAAFAAMPITAQANAPHYFGNGLSPANTYRLAPTTIVSVLEFGALTFRDLTRGVSVTCPLVVVNGSVENPVPGLATGPAGKGDTISFTAVGVGHTACTEPECSAAGSGGGPATYVSLTATVGTSKLIEQPASVFRPESAYNFDWTCHIETGVDQNGQPIYGVVIDEHFSGVLAPRWAVRCTPVTSCPEFSNPYPKIEFDSSAGTLTGTGGHVAELAGSLEVFGFASVLPFWFQLNPETG